MRNARSGLWEVLPWDLDITFGADHGNGREPFRDMVVGHLSQRQSPTEAPYTPQYRNRMREILQLLYNEEVFFPVLDEWYEFIKEIAAADLDRWDLFTPRDADPSKSRYQPLDYRLQEMKDWITQRIHTSYTDNGNDGRNFILSMHEMAFDPNIPVTPAIVSHTDGVRLPPEAVEFISSDYSDPNNAMHLASRWILTRDDGFEIQPDWDSGPSQQYRRILRLNLGAFEPGAYRLRVRHLNLSDRWSWFSEPLRFTIDERVDIENWSLY